MKARPVFIPDEIKNAWLEIEKKSMEDGSIGWGEAYDINPLEFPGYKGVYLVPISSNGAAQYVVLRYWNEVLKLGVANIPYNTMQGLKNLYREILTTYEYKNSPWNHLESIKDDNPKDIGPLIYTPVGGYVFDEDLEFIKQVAEGNIYPILVDGAHVAGLEIPILSSIGASPGTALVTSYFATKVLAVGEGSFILTRDLNLARYAINGVMYGKFFPAGFSINFRMRAPDYRKILYVYENSLIDKFIEPRVKVANVYRKVLDKLGVSYVVPSDTPGRIKFDNKPYYNGYKLIINDERLSPGDLGKFESSQVFNFVKHVATANYPDFLQYDNLEEEFHSVVGGLIL